MEYDFDLFVLGAGSGGVRASRIASKAGARVAICEESRVGGTCVLRGCIPKKVRISSFPSSISHQLFSFLSVPCLLIRVRSWLVLSPSSTRNPYSATDVEDARNFGWDFHNKAFDWSTLQKNKASLHLCNSVILTSSRTLSLID